MGARLSGEAAWRRSRIVVPVVSPAAGVDWTFQVPAGHIYQLVSIYAQLVTSAVVATRIARLAFGDGVRTYLDVPPFATQVASLTRRYAWLVSPTGVAQGSGILSSMPEIAPQPGWTVASVTDAIDVGDQWSAIFLHVVDTTFKRGKVDLFGVPDLFVAIADPAPGTE